MYGVCGFPEVAWSYRTDPRPHWLLMLGDGANPLLQHLESDQTLCPGEGRHHGQGLREEPH